MKHYEGDEFPIHIDLGRMPDERDVPMEATGDKKEKRKPYYPTLYISGIEGLGDLPKDGCALIEFHRNRVSVDTPEDEKGSGSVELQIKTICLMEDSGDNESLADALKKGMREKGVEIDDGSEGEEDEEE